MGSDEYEAGVCGGNWWNSSTSLFGSSLCASSLHHDHPIAWHRKSKSSTSLDSLLPHTIIHENHEGSTSYPSILQEDLNSSGFDCSEIKTQDSSFIKPANQDFANTNSSAVSSFQMNSSLTNYPSTLLQTLFDNDHPLLPQQQMNFPSSLNYMDDFSPLLRPCLPKQSLISNWNSSANSLNSIRGNLLPSMSSQLPFNEKSTVPSVITKSKVDEFQESRSKSAALKRARMETPSPLPTFKVRKEKLGNRITALQQMVSPFGKTDTASVLHEANEYIKFLHDQVKVLSTPYLKSRVQHQQSTVKEGPKQDLRSRGMCLVPISTTFPVTTETTTDFWTPRFT